MMSSSRWMTMNTSRAESGLRGGRHSLAPRPRGARPRAAAVRAAPHGGPSAGGGERQPTAGARASPARRRADVRGERARDWSCAPPAPGQGAAGRRRAAGGGFPGNGQLGAWALLAVRGAEEAAGQNCAVGFNFKPLTARVGSSQVPSRHVNRRRILFIVSQVGLRMDNAEMIRSISLFSAICPLLLPPENSS